MKKAITEISKILIGLIVGILALSVVIFIGWLIGIAFIHSVEGSNRTALGTVILVFSSPLIYFSYHIGDEILNKIKKR